MNAKSPLDDWAKNHDVNLVEEQKGKPIGIHLSDSGQKDHSQRVSILPSTGLVF
ncbi:MAG: hypothetical protein GY822_04860 [Deltaproteobacteria bacterium]|nr:hypothetical protein [Deltaproteobacteria bacterium]